MDYEIKRLLFDDEDQSLSKLVELQNIVYNDHKHVFTVEGFKHWYLENPMGKVISFNAFYEGTLVAHYACIPIKMIVDRRVVNGLLDMSTVTHPKHRGKGLFRTLAKVTYEQAVKDGYEFVVGVANDNSFPGYMKYFKFNFIGKLDVKIGFGTKIFNIPDKTFSSCWNEKSLNWRLASTKYSLFKNTAVGKTNFSIFRNIVGIKTLMGVIPEDLINKLSIKRSSDWLRPVNLYIGLGADISKGFYFNVPKFIKHPPFNLIFLDLTNGSLPIMSKDNVFFQLMDFDVA